MALLGLVVFWATCGVKPRSRTSAGGIVGFVGAERSPLRAGSLSLEHGEGGVTFGTTGGLGQLGVDDQSVSVLHEEVPGIGELGRRGVGRSGQAGLGVGA